MWCLGAALRLRSLTLSTPSLSPRLLQSPASPPPAGWVCVSVASGDPSQVRTLKCSIFFHDAFVGVNVKAFLEAWGLGTVRMGAGN